MPDVISKVDYFSVLVSNKPGEALKVLTALKDAGVDLTGFWGYPIKGKKAVLDILPADAKAFTAAAKKLKLDCSKKKTCFLATGEDQPGALAGIVAKITAAGLNIHAAQAIKGGGGRYGALIQVADDDVKKAKKALGA
jgi:hypothetical protein